MSPQPIASFPPVSLLLASLLEQLPHLESILFPPNRFKLGSVPRRVAHKLIIVPPSMSSMSWDTAAVQKAETLRLSSFNSQTAHTLGESIRAHIRKQYPGRGAIVQITSGSTEQLLYFSTSDEGTLLDNKVWAQRKWRSVIRFGKSTASLNIKW